MLIYVTKGNQKSIIIIEREVDDIIQFTPWAGYCYYRESVENVEYWVI